NLEFFSQNPETTEGLLGESLGKRLFNLRLELIGELDKDRSDTIVAREEPETDLRSATADLLRQQIAAMNVENFVVRPRRELVEHVTPAMLGHARKRLRPLLKHIDKTHRKTIYTDFVDVMGSEKEIGFDALAVVDDFEQFRPTTRRFLREREDHIAIHKLRM